MAGLFHLICHLPHRDNFIITIKDPIDCSDWMGMSFDTGVEFWQWYGLPFDEKEREGGVMDKYSKVTDTFTRTLEDGQVTSRYLVFKQAEFYRVIFRAIAIFLWG
jgi:hypothetical protein